MIFRNYYMKILNNICNILRAITVINKLRIHKAMELVLTKVKLVFLYVRLDIVLDIEDKFDINIEDDVIGEMNTVADAVDVVMKKTA